MKKTNIAFQFSSFLLSDGFFPEKQIYYDLKQSSNNLNSNYNFIYKKNCGLLSEDLLTLKKVKMDFDISILSNQIKMDNTFAFYANWMPSCFTAGHEFLLFSICQNTLILAGDNIDSNQNKINFFNFSPDAKIYEPMNDFSNAKIFYIAFSQPLQRHKELITFLDKNNYASFFGPQNEWNGVKNYIDSVPFEDDIAYHLNKYGICLAIHSPIHEYYEINTTRVAEGCRAGSVIITNKMKHLEETFGDSIFTINFNGKTESEVCNEIEKIVNWIRQNPLKAKEMAKKSQQIFYENFLKENWIDKFCTKAMELKNEYILQRQKNQTLVDVLYFNQSEPENVNHVLDQILEQYHQNFNLIIVSKPKHIEKLNKIVSLRLSGKNISYSIISTTSDIHRCNQNNTGSMFLLAKDCIKGEAFAILDETCIWNSDHISNLLIKMQEENNICVYSGVFYESNGLRYFNTIYNNEHSNIDNIYLPITYSNWCDFMRHKNFINLDNTKDLSDFEELVEKRFIKGCQLFSSKILNLMQNTDKLNNTDGCEHLCLAITALINNDITVQFSQQISSGLKICNIPKNCKELNQIRYSLYPNRPLIETNYRRSTCLAASGLFEVFFQSSKFLSFCSKYYNTLNDRFNAVDSRFNAVDNRFNVIEKKVFRFKRLRRKIKSKIKEFFVTRKA